MQIPFSKFSDIAALWHVWTRFKSLTVLSSRFSTVVGFLSWDKDSCHVDLEKELLALVAQAPEGEEARNGDYNL